MLGPCNKVNYNNIVDIELNIDLHHFEQFWFQKLIPSDCTIQYNFGEQ